MKSRLLLMILLCAAAVAVQAQTQKKAQVGFRFLENPVAAEVMGRGGTGLGMHIVHTIVTRVLGGHITVTTQPGTGTQVRVVFPSVLASADNAVHDQSAIV